MNDWKKLLVALAATFFVAGRGHSQEIPDVDETADTAFLAAAASIAGEPQGGACLDPDDLHYIGQGIDLCDQCCDAPLWDVSVGAVILERTRPHPAVLLRDPTTGQSLGNAANFQFDWAGGPDVAVARRLAGGDAIEVRYFGVDDWVAQRSLGTESFSVIRGTYNSQLQSVEVNWRNQVADRIAWIWGFRWVELHESLDASVFLGLVNVSLDTDNHLYGAQMGPEILLWDRGGPVRVETALKGGIYGNSADSAFGIDQNFNPGIPTMIGNGLRNSQVAFLGDISLTATYQWTKHIAVRAGYQLIWVEGVAVASDQASLIDLSDPFSGNIALTGIDVLGGVFYHGALVSLNLAW